MYYRISSSFQVSLLKPYTNPVSPFPAEHGAAAVTLSDFRSG